MYFVTPLLCLQIVLSLAAKQGNFGIFRACTKKNNLRLECSYAPCPGSPPYTCHISSSDVAPPRSTTMCNWTIPHHKIHYVNTTTHFNCTLTRRNRVETKKITVNYSIKIGKHRTRPCLRGAGSMQQPVLTCLWPSVIWMWIVLVKGN